MTAIKRLLPHLCLILSLFFLILLVLNDYNPSMNFIANGISLALLAVLCAATATASLIGIFGGRKQQGQPTKSEDADE